MTTPAAPPNSIPAHCANVPKPPRMEAAPTITAPNAFNNFIYAPIAFASLSLSVFFAKPQSAIVSAVLRTAIRPRLVHLR